MQCVKFYKLYYMMKWHLNTSTESIYLSMVFSHWSSVYLKPKESGIIFYNKYLLITNYLRKKTVIAFLIAYLHCWFLELLPNFPLHKPFDNHILIAFLHFLYHPLLVWSLREKCMEIEDTKRSVSLKLGSWMSQP